MRPTRDPVASTTYYELALYQQFRAEGCDPPDAWRRVNLKMAKEKARRPY